MYTYITLPIAVSSIVFTVIIRSCDEGLDRTKENDADSSSSLICTVDSLNNDSLKHMVISGKRMHDM